LDIRVTNVNEAKSDAERMLSQGEDGGCPGDQLGSVDKLVLTPARPEQFGRRNTHVGTGVMR
jgi:hypothetical protein